MVTRHYFRVFRLLLIISGILIIILLTGCEYEVTEYNSLDDYGIITGNYDNKPAEEVFAELFPEAIPESFADPVYHYKAEKCADSTAYEIALEFSMDDPDDFEKYVESVSSEGELLVFPYDNEYLYYPISSQSFILNSDNSTKPCSECDGKPEHYHIASARIAMLIVQPEIRNVILFGMGVADGGGVSTYDLNWIFSRFNIAPIEFARDHPYISNRDK